MNKITRRTSLTILLLLATVCLSMAQIVTPVKWNKTIKMTDGKNGVLTFNATIDQGWHMYAMNIPDGGPVPLSVDWKTQGVKLVGQLTPSKAPYKVHDKTFDIDLTWWTGNVSLSQKFTVTGKEYQIGGTVRSMACNDETCTPPANEPFSFKGSVTEPPQENAAPAVAPTAQDSMDKALPEATLAAADSATGGASTHADLWAPVKLSDKQAMEGDNSNGNGRSLWYIFWACFLGGLVALLTPCVWPMIPMTVSFFLKKSGSRGKSISNALTYGISIIVIFLLLGILFTAIFGANALNAMATNAVVNIIFFLLLVVFAISFFGAFEIKLPDSWSNKMDSNAEKTTGLLSIFFMASTLVIVSFSCTGPIIGTLLVEAASQGNMMGPLVGMTGFAIALAIPFALFALFPSMLKKLPKSGGWLNTVNVVLGFIELALALK